MNAKLLFVGDIHLGKLPSGLPDRLVADTGVHQDLGPVGAWRRTVDQAVEQGVDAVVLAGDVVHAENARFEAFGPLVAGVEKLNRHGIQVCCFGSFLTSVSWKKYSSFHAPAPPTMNVGE